MAQAATDLHKPQTQATDSPADADEMLSQLAGSEIDRLMAEAEKATEAAAAEPASEEKSVSEETIRDEAALTGELDNLFKELQSTDYSQPAEASGAAAVPPTVPAAPTPETQPDPAPTGTPLTKQLDELNREVPAPPAVVESSPQAPAASLTNQLDELFTELNKDTAAPAPAAPDPLAATSEIKSESAPQNGERSALLEAAGFDAAASAPAAQDSERAAVLSAAGFESTGSDEPDDGPKPFYIKILEWLNSPLRSSPDTVRHALGRAAIVTLVNSVLVIGYVLIFRKH